MLLAIEEFTFYLSLCLYNYGAKVIFLYAIMEQVISTIINQVQLASRPLSLVINILKNNYLT